MKMLSRVCAEFKNKQGAVIFRITPADRLRYIDDAPDEIQEDLLFRMLLEDGSIEVVETAAQRKAMEQDPTAGTLADGRKASNVKAESKADSKAKAAEETPAEKSAGEEPAEAAAKAAETKQK